MAVGTILVVDDEPDLRTVYELALRREGYEVSTAGCVQEGKEQLAKSRYDIVITDMRMPDGLGLELVQLINQERRSEKCLVVTAFGSAENAVEALKAGAFDYLTKPVNLKQLRQIVADAIASNAEQILEAETEPEAVKPEPTSSTQNQDDIAAEEPVPVAPKPEGEKTLLGQSAVMQNVRDVIAKVAVTMAPVLVHGESGTGKELVAHAIHQQSHRRRGPFIAVNCGAIPENLMEAEFFGYLKGAFTGANEDRDGLFAAAAGGTIFLDEIGELPLQMQSKLLRVIQERSVRPIGASQELNIDVRIVSATHRNLADDVRTGRFRQDLYYRLNVIEVIVPPLRERKEDIEELTMAILNKVARESSLAILPIFEERAKEKLLAYAFPGNVRELENIIQRAVAMSDGSVIYENDLLMTQAVRIASQEEEISPAKEVEASRPQVSAQEEAFSQKDELVEERELPDNLSEYLDRIERDKLIQALELHHYNRTAAAAQLGMSLRQIRYRMERLHIDVPDENQE